MLLLLSMLLPCCRYAVLMPYVTCDDWRDTVLRSACHTLLLPLLMLHYFDMDTPPAPCCCRELRCCRVASTADV